ncbi:MAG: hypothetical protein V2I33_24975, partial [Kangiellaceae bacterium]|nr:hypothetical protein [Kangiellaceae bacterium]
MPQDINKTTSRKGKDGKIPYLSVLSISTEDDDSSQSPSEEEIKEVICETSFSEGSWGTCVTLRHSNVTAFKGAEQHRQEYDDAETSIRGDKSNGNEKDERSCHGIPRHGVYRKHGKGIAPSTEFAFSLDESFHAPTKQGSSPSFSKGKNTDQILHGGLKEEVDGESKGNEKAPPASIFVSYDNTSTFDSSSLSTSSETVTRLPSIREQCEEVIQYFPDAKMGDKYTVDTHNSDGKMSLTSTVAHPDSLFAGTDESICPSIRSLDNHVQEWEMQYAGKDLPQTKPELPAINDSLFSVDDAAFASI